MIRHIPITSCANCPYRKFNYGEYECSNFNYHPISKDYIQSSNAIYRHPPDWCPLPPHPAFMNINNA